MNSTIRIRQQAHDIANRLGRRSLLWPYYTSLAECLDDLVSGEPLDPYDCIPFTVYKSIEDDARFVPEDVAKFKAEWAKDIAQASVMITGIANDMKNALGGGTR